MVEDSGRFDALLQEERTFPPSQAFIAQSNISDPDVYEEAKRDPEAFWAKFADELDWFKKWDTVLEWDAPHAKWFIGGKLNVSYNCIDRHLATGRRNKAALIWEGEPGDRRVYTYWDLYREVCQFANGLKSLGVKKGDRVTIYLPMIPELPIAMLACARIGAAHSVVFGGFIVPVNGDDGEEVVQGPGVREGLKEREVAIIGVAEELVEAPHVVGDIAHLAGDFLHLAKHLPEEVIASRAGLKVKDPVAEERSDLLLEGDGVVVGLLEVFLVWLLVDFLFGKKILI